MPDDDEIEAMAVHFNGRHSATGEIVCFGTLLMHPLGPSMVMGPDPDREISADVLVRCMEAADVMCHQLSADTPDEIKVRHYAVRALLYQMLDRNGLVDDGTDNDHETLQ
jgi:hypothetical protein